MSANGVTRGVKAEITKLSWRSPIFYAYLPLAVLIPIVLNAAIAIATQKDLLMGNGGMETSNAGFWIITFTTLILMLAAVSSTCSEYSYGSIGKYLSIQPRRSVLPVSKLLTYGGLGLVISLVTTLIVIIGFPLIFPDVWGPVEPFSTEGWRLIYGIPLLTFFTCALGVGLSLLVRRAGTVVLLVVLWKYGVEVFATYIPGDGGIVLQRLSPFKNAELGAGQAATFDSYFGGPIGSLAYFAVICAIFFGIGLWRLSARDVDTD